MSSLSASFSLSFRRLGFLDEVFAWAASRDLSPSGLLIDDRVLE